MRNLKVCELLGVIVNIPFEIIGQNYSNPYTFINNSNFTYLIDKNGKKVDNWVVCNLINGELKIKGE